MKISWDQALAWRMRRHHLVDRAAPADLVAVVDRLRGLHAQVMSSVDLALWARIEGLTRQHVADALWRDRTLIKMWAMRATLHVLPAADLGTWVAGLSIWKPGAWPMKSADGIPIAGFIAQALRGKVLTRPELAEAMARTGATPKMVADMLGSWSASLRYASFFGDLCFAPSDGTQARFTHPETWLGRRTRKVDQGKAIDLLTLRYLAAYGPATPLDLGPRWWGINQTEAKRRFAALGDRATQVTIEGQRYWMRAEDVAELEASAPIDVVRLLPAFDQWVVCASRRVPALLDPAYRGRIYRQQGWVSPVLLVNGRMAGVWTHAQKGRMLRVDVEPFAKLPRRIRPQIEAEAERLTTFLGAELELRVLAPQMSRR